MIVEDERLMNAEDRAAAAEVDVLIAGGTVITMDRDRRVIRDGAIAIDGSRIVGVGKAEAMRKRYRPRRLYEANRKCVVPGLINSHLHFYHILHKNLPPEHLGGVAWSDYVHRNVAATVTPEDEILGGLLVLIEGLRCGVTTFLEAGSYAVDEVLEGVAAIGMRGFVGRRSFDLVAHGHDMLVDSTEYCLAETERLLREYEAGIGLVRPCSVIVGNGRCSDELIKGAKALADRYGTVLHMHHAAMVENLHEAWDRHGCRPTRHLGNIGVLDRNVVLVHMLQVDQSEVELLAETGTNVVHCPSTAMKVNYGLAHFGRFPEMHHAGVNVVLGTDGFDCSGDMLRLMALSALVAKDVRYDPSAGTAEEMLEAATINGARALGLEHELGSLEPGKKADISIYDMRRPDWAPVHNEVRNLVYSADGSSCESVLIDGRFVYDNRRVTTLDEDEIFDRVRFNASRLVERAGITVPSLWPVV
jgi:5-methylthioadenosine/S-adenosylhomocysteine deaminase